MSHGRGIPKGWGAYDALVARHVSGVKWFWREDLGPDAESRRLRGGVSALGGRLRCRAGDDEARQAECRTDRCLSTGPGLSVREQASTIWRGRASLASAGT